MDDFNVLPLELQSKSLSNSEIVLKLDDAIKAVGILCNNKWGILGWEVWFRYPNGQHSHFFQYDGVTYIEASDWIIESNQDWESFVSSSAEQCVNEITRSYSDWKEKCLGSGIEPFYCITASEPICEESK